VQFSWQIILQFSDYLVTDPLLTTHPQFILS
jgi:hypothetical protein